MKKEKKIIPKIIRSEKSEINRKIVLLFLEKLEKLTPEEREEILRTIQLINHPILVVEENWKKFDLDKFFKDTNKVGKILENKSKR